ncbi:Ycf66 family protein [Gloeomargarita sp.]
MGIGIPAPIFLGIVLILGGVILFFLGRLRPALRRDADVVYAIIALLSGLILLANFGNLGFGLVFQQVLMIGALVALTWENLILRSKNPTQRGREIPPRRPRDGYPPPSYRDADRDRSRQDVSAEAPRRTSRRRPSEVVLDPVDAWEAELPQTPRAQMRGESTPAYRDWDREEQAEAETAIVTAAPEPQERTRPRRPRPQYPPRRSRPSTWEMDNSDQFDDDDDF